MRKRLICIGLGLLVIPFFVEVVSSYNVLNSTGPDTTAGVSNTASQLFDFAKCVALPMQIVGLAFLLLAFAPGFRRGKKPNKTGEPEPERYNQAESGGPGKRPSRRK